MGLQRPFVEVSGAGYGTASGNINLKKFNKRFSELESEIL
jgi:hypothetical protein